MSNAYIRSLYRSLDTERDAEQQQPAPSSLHRRVVDWYDSLPAVSRYRPFAMAELEQALGTQGRYISPVLIRMGWVRKRKWSGSGPYVRYWVPP